MGTQHFWTSELESIARTTALDAGFHLFGIAGADAGPERSPDRFASWVAAGRAGEMEYLKRRDAEGILLRSGVRVAIPWAESIIVCAMNYNSTEPKSIDEAPDKSGWIGRYAWSGRAQEIITTTTVGQSSPAARPYLATDYHEQLLGRLKLVEAQLRGSVQCETRCYVDTGPIIERGFAANAGVGWIGKNTCVLNQQMGSWLLLGVIVTSLSVEGAVSLGVAADRCGSCTRCIDACPTDALVAPREMDASRCIAYLTIEKKGSIDPELREGMGRQVFGCDICQDVCPWNRKAPVGTTPGMEVRQELVNPSLAWLAQMDSQAFKSWFKGSPLERTGRKRLHRNVAIAMGNSGEVEFLPQLRLWSEGEDIVLAEAARWAIDRIQIAQSVC